MFERIIDDYYKLLANTIKSRKEILKIKRDDMLPDPKRVTQITKFGEDTKKQNKNKQEDNKHHPYLIGKNEYVYLYCLFIYKDKESFLHEKILESNVDDIISKNGDNYDKMLWGCINWDKMFKDVVTELSELDSSESLGKLFDDTLIDYVPYAVIRYDELHPEYGKEYIFPDERGKERENAIHWVYLRHGSDFFKKVFYQKFGGKTLDKFPQKFKEFVEDYLQKSKPNQYSLGLQAYNLHRNISGFAAYWQSLAEVRYSDMYTKKSDLEKQLEEYLANGRKQIQKYKKYQKDFDSFGIDISFNN